jgi:hypothetical protein
MGRVVYLHVGAPKTGTTYVQDRLRRNRVELSKHGIHYPIGLHAGHFNAALDLVGRGWAGGHPDVAGEWDSLVRRVGRKQGTVIIDSEILAAATPDRVQSAMEDLADSQVHIVYSARDLARQIPAAWGENVKHGRTESFARFTRRVVKGADTPSAMWFWRAQGLPDVLSRWATGLPPDRVHLVTVPGAGAPPGSLWLRFCEVFGIEPAWAPEGSGLSNPSMGMAATEMLRRLNARLNSTSIDPAIRESLVKELLAHRTLAPGGSVDGPVLPEKLRPWAEEMAERWIEWVRSSGINVVGDLEELRPNMGPRAAATQPRAPRNGEVLDAALDALVAMTEEAARRTAPEDRLMAKMVVGMRRMRGE